MREVIIGPCKLIQADCMDVLPTVMGGDAVVTDPPYCIVDKFGETTHAVGRPGAVEHRRMQFDFDQPEGTIELIAKAVDTLMANASAIHCFCAADHFGTIAAMARKHGCVVKKWARIKKCPPPPMPGNWWPDGFELAMYGFKSGAWFGDESGNRVNTYTCDGYRHGIRAAEKCDHPTQKWLPMIVHIVGSIVPPNGSCIDPFMGSGTTGVACIQTDRRFIGIEREPKYFQIACDRIQRAWDLKCSELPFEKPSPLKQRELLAT